MNVSVIANNLRKLRTEKHYTQEQAAQLLSVSSQSVSRWECGNTLPEVTLLPEIARVYAVTVDDLFREDCCTYQNYAHRLLAVYESSRRLEDYFAARKEFERLFASGNYTANDLRSFGILNQYLMNDAADQALTCFDKVLDRQEKDTVYYSTWRQKITLLSQIGRAEEAVSTHEEQLRSDPENPEQWILLVASYFLAENYEKAYACVQQAIEKFPTEALLYIYAGNICESMKKYEEAFACWEKALKLDSDCMDALYSMGYCYEELGQFQKAYEVWKTLAAELTKKGFEVERELPIQQARMCQAKL